MRQEIYWTNAEHFTLSVDDKPRNRMNDCREKDQEQDMPKVNIFKLRKIMITFTRHS